MLNRIKKLSFIIPVFNEKDSIVILFEKIRRMMLSLSTIESWEIIFVDDGSTDGSPHVISNLCDQHENVLLISFRRNLGKSAALTAGFETAAGDVIITMDGDLQDEPNEVPKMLEKLKEGYDLISGWKKKRNDPFEKRFASRIFNFVVSKVTGVELHDFNCGFKAYRSWTIRDLKLSGNWHRFLPVLVSQRGGRIAEVTVAHHRRVYDKSKYGYKRYFHGIADLGTVLLLTKFFQKPGYFFSLIAAPILLFGISLGLFLLGGHIYYLFTGDLSYQLVDRPLLQISISLFATGLQIYLFGLLSEIILNVSGSNLPFRDHDKMYYSKKIAKRIDIPHADHRHKRQPLIDW